jgi:hypothetical protein
VWGERVGTYKSQSACDDHEEFPGEDGRAGIEQAIGEETCGNGRSLAGDPKERLKEPLGCWNEEHAQGDFDGRDHGSFNHAEEEAECDEAPVGSGGVVQEDHHGPEEDGAAHEAG